MKAFFSSRASDAQAPTAPSSSSAAAARSSSQRGLRGTKTTTKSSTTSKPSNTKSSTANTKPSKHEVGLVVKPVFPCSASASVSSDADADAHSAPSRRGRTRRDASAGPPAPAGPPRPSTPSSPVRIPKPGQAFAAKRQQVVAQRKRHPRQARPVEPISPSLAALLAVTDIPRPRRRQRGPDQPLTVDDIVADHHVSEKELSLTLTRRPLDLLLSPPDDLADGLSSACEGSVRCALARTTSADSIPSLGGDSFTSDTVSSLETPLGTVDLPSPRRRPSPVRRSLPSDAADGHPLAADADAVVLILDADSAASDADDERPADEAPKPQLLAASAAGASRPLRSVFRSNLTASLRALRSAARSFSGINLPSVPPDDLLTRSILTIDPKVPFADERRPPVTEEMPSAELRRYLNPTTGSLVEVLPPPSRYYSASIQMQTYKVQRSRSPQALSRAASPSAAGGAPGPHQALRSGSSTPVPGMRQREMRENPDFIRIAVMEMAMRKRGKLDAQRPGRARWALPPRRPTTKPYEIGPNGVPARWTPMSC